MAKIALLVAGVTIACVLSRPGGDRAEIERTIGARGDPRRGAELEARPRGVPEAQAFAVSGRSPTGDVATRGASRDEVDSLLRAPTCPDVHAPVVSELRDPRESLATLRGGNVRSTRPYRVGDAFGRARVRFIGTHPREREPRVWLERDGSLCQAGLSPPPGLASGGVPAAPAPDPARAPDVRALIGPVRVVPTLGDGGTVGLRVVGVRAGSLLTLLGMQNGDVIESVDGRELTPERALEAYARYAHRTSDHLTLGIRRRGAPMELEYRFD